MKKKAKNCIADRIQVLTGIEHVRKRPKMYIGDLGERGVLFLFQGLVESAIEQAESRVSVRPHRDGSISVEHDGLGISTDKHSKVGKPILSMIMTELGCGSTAFSSLPIINAFSRRLVVETTWDDPIGDPARYSLTFVRGVAQSAIEVVEATTDKRGTCITFSPDPEIFGDAALSIDQVDGLLGDKREDHPDLEIFLEGLNRE